jgi:hypothetical protein
LSLEAIGSVESASAVTPRRSVAATAACPTRAKAIATTADARTDARLIMDDLGK